MKKLKLILGALTAAAIVAGCGGGGGTATSTGLGINTVKVVGDSLSDSGVFGIKFAMQGSVAEPMKIWTERIAATYGAASLCPRYAATSASTVALNPAAAACTSYAVGGGRINIPTAPTSGFSIPEQLKQLAIDKTYGAGDLLLVDGGGNDAADLTGAYLKVSTDGGASYSGLLKTLVASGTVDSTLATGAAGFVSAGNLYMTALADKFYDVIKLEALDRGAARIAVLNMPGITNTPRFQDTLNLVALANGGGVAGATARATVEAVIKGWAETFNARLASKFAGNSKVVLVDFYTGFNDQVANPSAYALTNVRTPACPSTGTGTDGLPTYNAATCTSTALSAMTPPVGATGGANWWRTYAFSDGFHPTMFGYQLLAQAVAKDLAKAGWL